MCSQFILYHVQMWLKHMFESGCRPRRSCALVFIYEEAGNHFSLFTGEPDPSGNGKIIS